MDKKIASLGESSMFQGNRKYGLDILRAFAILFVVYGHGRNLLGSFYNKVYELLVLDGVSIFFVLSGFLIGGILIRTIEQTNFNWNDLFHFWIRRWFRTLPNFYLILIILIIIRLYYNTANIWPFFRVIYKYFIFFQNFNTPHPGFFNEAWSLPIEEWFYLLIPISLFLIFRLTKVTKKQVLLFWILFIITAVTIYRSWVGIHIHVSDIETWDLYLRKQVLTRLDSLMFGFLGAYFAHYNKQAWNKRKTPLFFLGMALLLVNRLYTYFSNNDILYLSYFSFTVTSLGTLMILPKLNSIPKGSGVVYKFLTFTSIVSYSMYLLHLSLIQKQIMPMLFGNLQATSLFEVVRQYFLYWFLTFLLSTIMFVFYENPMTQLRDKFKKQEQSHTAS